jgi:V8-like Glu-specific endopeptidase
MLRLAGSFVAAVLLTVSAQVVLASTIRHDVSDSEYTGLAANYPCVGKILGTSPEGGYIASGTLISPQWMLTAAHVLKDSTSLSFTINGNPYAADLSQSVYYPGYNKNTLTGDIAVVRLSSAVTGITTPSLYSGTTTSLLTLTGTLVGYGATGTGLTG